MKRRNLTKQQGKVSLWLAVPLAFITVNLVLYLLFANMILKSIAQNALSEANGAEVNIAYLKHSLFPFGITLEGVQVTDNASPMRNKVEISSAKADVGFGALIKSKLLVEDLIIEDLAFGTQRTTEGFVLEQVASEGFKFPTMQDLPSVDEVLANTPLKTTEAIAQAKGVYDKYKAPLKEQASALPSKEKIEDYKARMQALKNVDYKDPTKLIEAKAAFDKLKDEIKADLATAKTLKETASSAKTELSSTTALLKSAPEQDYELLKGLVAGEEAAIGQVTQHLFGDKAQLYTQGLLMAVDMLQQTGDAAPEELVVDDSGLPSVWIKNAKISMILADQSIASSWSNITENHALVGQATQFAMQSLGTDSGKKLDLKGSFEIIEGLVNSQQSWDVVGLALNAVELVPEDAQQSLSALIESSILNSKGSLSIDANTLSGKSNIDFNQLALKARGESDITKSIADVIENINQLALETDFGGSLLAPNISLSSDLDKKVISAISASFKEGNNPKLNELKQKLNAKVSEQLGASNADLADVDNILAAVSGDTDSLNDLLKQELNNVIDDKKDKLLNKLKDKLFKP